MPTHTYRRGSLVAIIGLFLVASTGCLDSNVDAPSAGTDVPKVDNQSPSTDVADNSESGTTPLNVNPNVTQGRPDEEPQSESQIPAFEMLLFSKATTYYEALSVTLFGGRLTVSSLPECVIEVDADTQDALRLQAEKVDWKSHDSNRVCYGALHRRFDATVRYQRTIQQLPSVNPFGPTDTEQLKVRDFSYCEFNSSFISEELYNLLQQVEDIGKAQCEGFPQLIRSEDEQYTTERERFRAQVKVDIGGPHVALNTILVEAGFIHIPDVGQAPIPLSDYDFRQIKEMVANIGDSGHSEHLEWCPQYVPKISISGSMQGDSGDEASSGGRFAYCMADIKTRVPEDAEYLARRLESLIFRATKRVITLTPTYTDALDEDESGVVHSTGDVDVAVYYNNPFPNISYNTGYFGGVFWLDSECRSKQVKDETITSLTNSVADLIEYDKTHDVGACVSDTPTFRIWARMGSDYMSREFCSMCTVQGCNDLSVVVPLINDLKTMRSEGCLM